MHGGYIEKDYILNNRIRFPKLRVIDDENGNLGILDTSEALKIAIEKELDLVVVTANANPPVAKILDFKKFLYSERKKSSENKGKQAEMKELRIGPNTSDGDIDSKASRAKEFISEGHQVKVSAVMKGRQAMFPEVALEKLRKFIAKVSEEGKADGEPKRMGNTFSVVISKK